MSTPYRPVTKEAAAELFSVSIRTIDNWIANGTLPMPKSVGRRVYWHPAVLRAWEDDIFGCYENADDASNTPQNRPGRPRTKLSTHRQ